MQKTSNLLRIAASRETKWDPEGRERTINTFLKEVSWVATEHLLEYMAEHYPKKLENTFFDWVRFHKKRNHQQRVALLTEMMAKHFMPITFGFAEAGGNKDLELVEQEEPEPENVVSLFAER